MKRLSREERRVVELWVDRFGLDGVLDALREICCEKSEHIDANWQDPPSSKTWGRAADKIANLNADITKRLPGILGK